MDSSSDFGKCSQSIAGNIHKISVNVSSMSRMVGQIGTAQDSEMTRKKLHEMQHATNMLAKDTSEMMIRLNDIVQESDHQSMATRKIAQRKLAEELTAALNTIQTTNRQCIEREKASILRTRANSGAPQSMVNPFSDDGDDNDESNHADDQTFNTPSATSAVMEQNVDVQVIQERESALRELERDILDVNQIFKDLAVMVHDQGEVVDSIESNVDQAAIQVEVGNTELSRASDYRRSTRKKKLICFILLVILIFILALIIYFSVKPNN